MHKLLAAVAVAVLAPCVNARAQTGTLVTPIIVNDSPSLLAAVAGMMQTPVAALPPITTSTINGEVQQSIILSVRYGYVGGPNGFSSNNAGLTAILPIAAFGSTLSLTGGFSTCNLCGTSGMAGIGADFRIYERIFHPRRDPTRLLFTLSANAGYASSANTALSNGAVYGASVSMPISILPSWHVSDEMRFVPFVAPGIGFGWSHGSDRLARVGPGGQLEIINESANGTRFIVGGGIAVYRRKSPWALNFGAQYIGTHTDNIMAGIGVNYGGR
jgi:hypothetical protein